MSEPTERPSPAAVDHEPRWATFDAVWYVATYGDAMEDPAEDPALFYQRRGVLIGHAPNPFFDERGYLAQYADVAEAVAHAFFESGFQHYREVGFPSRAPHWLFSEHTYIANNRDLGQHVFQADGFVNGYDHYLSRGDLDFRSGSLFFDPQLFRDQSRLAEQPLAADRGCFEQFVSSTGPLSDVRTSLYFDPDWYLRTYPDVSEAIRTGAVRCALHHYLTNDTPLAFNPGPLFDETLYAQRNPDIAAIVDQGGYRNGFDHFLRYGCFELRSGTDAFDLRAYAARPDVAHALASGQARDAFAHKSASLLRASPPSPELAAAIPAQYETLIQRRATSLVPLVVRSPLSFGNANEARVAVVVVARNGFGQTLATLTRLREACTEPLELIVVDRGSRDETRHLEHFVHGARILRLSHDVGLAEGFNAALAVVRAPVCLWIEPGMEPLFGLIDAVTDVFAGDSAVGAVAGRVLQPDGRVAEAGVLIARDAGLHRLGAGSSASAPEVGYSRRVGCATAGALAVRTRALRDIGGLAREFSDFAHLSADLCLRLAGTGSHCVYTPDMLLGAPTFLPPEASDPDDGRLRLRAAHLSRLRFLPSGPATGLRGAYRERSTLVLVPRLPRQVVYGNARRLCAIVTELASRGPVTVLSAEPAGVDLMVLRRALPSNVEILHDRGLDALAPLLRARTGVYDHVWVLSPELLARAVPALREAASALPTGGLVLDAPALGTPRVTVGTLTPGEGAFNAALRQEFHAAWFAQALVAATPGEALELTSAGLGTTRVVGVPVAARTDVPSWAERRNIVCAGVFNNPPSLELSGLEWLLRRVLPEVFAALPDDTRLIVTGPAEYYISFAALVADPRVVYRADEPDLDTLYDRARVFVSPATFTTEVAAEALSAAAAGVPVVTTAQAASQLALGPEAGFLPAGDADAALFAHQIVSAYTHEGFWTELSMAGRRTIPRLHGSAVFRQSVQAALRASTAATLDVESA
ncbi:glycosyltransferase [Ameyamaea chiangmaiensis NBRC 103196]|uniref:Glycosyltransferase n=1 Tax=Ameyamaea chiangmaiensis TaxID=442969 RepID=A0A850P888_9PROT|nr:glycosyltransferase [Ameyamaea chiangmaiensis]MBS4073801.1 glycosyltransferase [Ameyamaea chiangmaiensis]NVN39203.1 glycosyltransferase [Ameyamaea chiangmaiensis]GBQ68399.1 glycosyltransferase [Ameyamaea chiangmaiensis NBRC 103196]